MVLHSSEEASSSQPTTFVAHYSHLIQEYKSKEVHPLKDRDILRGQLAEIEERARQELSSSMKQYQDILKIKQDFTTMLSTKNNFWGDWQSYTIEVKERYDQIMGSMEELLQQSKLFRP